MATYPNILVWRTPWTGEPGGPQSTRSQSLTQLSDWAHNTVKSTLHSCSSIHALSPQLQHNKMHTTGKYWSENIRRQFFFFFIYGNFFLEIVNRLQGKLLLISGFIHRQGGSLLQPLRRCCLPEMIDEPIWKLPCSFQRVKHFYFFFFVFVVDQRVFLVRKCSGRRFLNLSCAFLCKFF